MTADELAKISLPLAIAAYSPCTSPDKSLAPVLNCHANPLIKAIARDEVAWGYVSRVGRSVYVTIRGTRTTAEWAGDFNAVAIGWWRGPGHIHAGIEQLYSALAPCLKEAVGDLLDVDAVYVTGHSLGCGPATLFAVELAYFYPALQIYLCTFASPRVGDAQFAGAVRGMKKLYAVRIANKNDIVTMEPPSFLWPHWSHIGNAHIFDCGLHREKLAHSLELTYSPAVAAMTPETPTAWIA